MPFTKDLIIATTVLVGCCLVLFLTLSEPSGREDGTVTVPGGPELAMGGDATTPPPADQPPAPPELDDGGSFAESGSSSLRFDVFDDPQEPEDEPLVADTTRTPALGGGDSPFGDPRLMDDGTVAPPPTGRRPQPGPPVIERRPEPAPTPGGPRGGSTHTVAKGETLMDVSFKYFGTHHKWREIMAANDVDPDQLVVGTVLTIPQLSNVVPASAQGRARGDGDYVVKKGDSYYTIARDVLGDSSRFQEVARLNSIDPYELKPGDVIKLPAGASVPAAGTATPSAAIRSPRELPPGGRWHTVEKYQVLGDISTKYYGTATRWREIAQANGISDPATLKEGQKLVIPGAGSGSSSSSTTGSSPSPSAVRGGSKLYTIQKGDLLESIARRQLGDGTRWKEIMALNPGLNPRKLKVGDQIALPADASSSAPSPSAVRTPAPAPRPRSTPAPETEITWPELDPTPRSGRSDGGGSPFDRIEP